MRPPEDCSKPCVVPWYCENYSFIHPDSQFMGNDTWEGRKCFLIILGCRSIIAFCLSCLADRISSGNNSILLQQTSWSAIRHYDSCETCQESKGKGLQQLLKKKNLCPGFATSHVWGILPPVMTKTWVRTGSAASSIFYTATLCSKQSAWASMLMELWHASH